jgi:acyl dehydratase
MQGTEYGERTAHRMLTLSFMSTGSTRLIERAGGLAVSYGYDRVRFVAPVRFGDTITVHYRVTSGRQEHEGLLTSGIWHLSADFAVGEALIYGDYYYMQALTRLFDLWRAPELRPTR